MNRKNAQARGMTILFILTNLAPCISYVLFPDIAISAVQNGCRGYDCLPGRGASVSVLPRNPGNSAAVCVCNWREKGAHEPGVGEGYLSVHVRHLRWILLLAHC